MKYILILLMLVSCSTPTLYKKVDGIREIGVYVTEFEKAYNKKVDRTRIKFEPTMPLYLGVCSFDKSFGEWEVIINSITWEDISLVERHQLVFHELGHCILLREHYGEMLLNGEPKSIMHPSVFATKAYKKNLKYYIDELFNPKKYNANYNDFIIKEVKIETVIFN